MGFLNKKTVDDIDLKGKRVLLRCDFNVPLKDGQITDDSRIVAALPTINKILEKSGKLIICSHLGKPKNGPDEKLSLAVVAKRLSEKLGKEVVFAADLDVVGENARNAVKNMKEGDVVLLENTRFRKEETKNDEKFSKELASLADVFVNDAFGAVHRAHCSTVGVAKYVLETAIGDLIKKELKFLGDAINNPKRPFVNILGGAKVSDKLAVIDNLLNVADVLIIGGGMSYTFLKAKGYDVMESLVDDSKIEYCKEMMKKAKEKSVKLLLPQDSVMIKDFPDPIDADVETFICDVDAMKKGYMSVDIGPKTAKLFADAVKEAKTVIWNGPMGVFENKKLAQGTKAVAQALANTDAITIVGGGDSAFAINSLGLKDRMSHISTGGGASLEFLEGKSLPGIECIDNLK